MSQISREYIDPVNKQEIIDKIKKARTIGDVLIIANEVFPGWIVGISKFYCKDYPSLTNTWNTLCAKMKVSSTQIIIVKEIDTEYIANKVMTMQKFDSKTIEHSLVSYFCECFTQVGFSVKSIHEVSMCPVCDCAIPTKEMWDLLKRNQVTVPDKWSPECTNCRQ